MTRALGTGGFFFVTSELLELTKRLAHVFL